MALSLALRVRTSGCGRDPRHHPATPTARTAFRFRADTAEEVEAVTNARRTALGKGDRAPVEFDQLAVFARDAVGERRLDRGGEQRKALGHVIRPVADVFDAEIRPVEQVEIVRGRQLDVALGLGQQVGIASRHHVGEHGLSRREIIDWLIDVDDLRVAELRDPRRLFAHSVTGLQ